MDTTLLVVDMVDHYLTRAGPYKRPVRPARLIDPIRQLVAGARERGHAVLWAMPEADPVLHPPLRDLRQAGDRVVLHASDVALGDVPLLRAADVGHLVLAGVTTPRQVRVTSRTALDHGFAVTVAADAVGAPTGTEQRDGLAALERDGADLRSVAEILGAWRVRLGGFGAGDSSIVYGVLPPESHHEVLATLRAEVDWQAMMHRGGRVPREVAIQGALHDHLEPLYRHPVDEQPALRPFTPEVDRLRRLVEEVVGQSLNHALIQRYPTRVANISLHADKTLDVQRGSTIVNLSVGATRTLLLQHKARLDTGGFTTERVELPHGSVFELGWETNRTHRHGIRPDRRAPTELRHDESRHEGERISLTFRSIATFRDADGRVTGQGARVGPPVDPELERQALLEAFGHENQDADFDWQAWYGSGFDLVNFRIRTVPVMR